MTVDLPHGKAGTSAAAKHKCPPFPRQWRGKGGHLALAGLITRRG